MCLAIRLTKHVAPAPTAPAWVPPTRQPVVDEIEKGRGVTLHDERELGIFLSQRTLAADVGLKPFVRNCIKVCAFTVAVIGVTADAGPSRIVILLAIRWRRTNDIEQFWEFPPDPGPGVVLIGNR